MFVVLSSSFIDHVATSMIRRWHAFPKAAQAPQRDVLVRLQRQGSGLRLLMIVGLGYVRS